MKSRFLVIIIALVTIAVYSCGKKDTTCDYTESSTVASSAEVQHIQDYLVAHNISGATQHPSGFFYKVENAGSGTAVNNLCATVTVQYKGYLENGKVFDSTATGATAPFTLGRLIPGWQKGIPLVKKGGTISLYIPPSLGYGSTAQGTSIPANSYLIFSVTVADISNQ
jgi:FKBP-type peptidyl-prolyl cis-trans isomerase FkpA